MKECRYITIDDMTAFFWSNFKKEQVKVGANSLPKSDSELNNSDEFLEKGQKWPKNPAADIVKLKAKKDSFLSN